MKSTEMLKPCPVCEKLVSAECVNWHISKAAYSESKSNLQTKRPHLDYKNNKK